MLCKLSGDAIIPKNECSIVLCCYAGVRKNSNIGMHDLEILKEIGTVGFSDNL